MFQILKLIDQNEDKFNEIIGKAALPKLTSAEIRFLREFVHVMQPVAIALDILQKDTNMYQGYLIPTVLSMEKQLQKRQRQLLDGKPLKFCDVLVRTLISAIRKPRRFVNYLDDQELLIAGVLLPCFKFDFITDACRQSEIRQLILEEMKEIQLDPKVRKIVTALSILCRTAQTCTFLLNLYISYPAVH
jgi:hypothetical protein